MNSEFRDDDALRIFESELQRELSGPLPDYGAIEERLFDRITDAEREGGLSLLKLDHIPPHSLLENVEDAVFKRIRDRVEYEEPVDDCIKNELDAPSPDWRSVESGLGKRIAIAAALSPVEQTIMADEILPEGRWEAIEERLDQTIAGVAPLEPWEQMLKAEVVPLQGSFEKIETALDDRMQAAVSLPDWELSLKRDELPPAALLERSEETLFDRIERHEQTRRRAVLSFAAYWGLLFSRYKAVIATTGSLLLLILMGGGYIYYRDYYHTLPMTVYQIQGPSVNISNASVTQANTISSEMNGGLTFVNKKGFVELLNGSGLDVIKASEKTVHFKTRFANADHQLIGHGSATFFVNRQKKSNRYIVSTGDYRVEVCGTYFRLYPDIGGHVSITVHEGLVKIVFNNGKVAFLKAGQDMFYDLTNNSYSMSNDAVNIPRHEIESLPDIEELRSFRRLFISSTPSAEVRIDGRYAGTTPIIILQPEGTHYISITKNGYISLDTTISVEAGTAQSHRLTASLQRLRDSATLVGRQPIEPIRITATAAVKRSNPDAPERTNVTVDSGESDFQMAETFAAGDWKNALDLYRKVFENPGAPPLRKETALFMMAKLVADNGGENGGAKESFLHYLAVYPKGYFVGESWLRLAELEFGNDQDKAIAYYLKYFEKYPRHYRIAELQHRVGLIYLQKKKYDEAIAMFKWALTNIQENTPLEKNKIYTSLYKALREKECAQNTLPVQAQGEKDGKKVTE